MPDRETVARSGLLLAVVLALCRLASLGKELLVAGRFGAGNPFDAYALAMLVPAIGLALYVNAVRRGYLVEFPRRLESAPDSVTAYTNRYLSQTILIAITLAVVATVGLDFLWPRVLGSNRPGVFLEHLEELSLPVAWLVVPMAVVSALTGILNARNQFAPPQWTHVIPTVSIVAAVLVLGTANGPAILAWGLLAGTSLQCLVLAVMVHRAGHRFSFRSGSPLEGAGQFLVLILPFLLLDILGQANVLVDRGMAGSLVAGHLSVLYWSALAKDFLSSTLIASVLWVLLPHFSNQVARGDLGSLRRSCSGVLKYAGVLMLPLTALLIVTGPSLLYDLSLQSLKPDDFRRLGACLAAYSTGLFPELAGLALIQALLVLGRWKLLALIGLFGLFLPNLVFNVLLIGPLQEAGLALSTGLTAWLLLAFSWIAVRQTIGIATERDVVSSLLRSLAFSCVAGLSAWLVDAGLSHVVPRSVSGAVAFGLGLGIFLLLATGWPGHTDVRTALSLLRHRRRGEPAENLSPGDEDSYHGGGPTF